MLRRWAAAVLALAAVAASPAAGTPTQVPLKGGTVVVGPVQEPTCLNPVGLACAGNVHFWITESVLGPAFATGPDFTARPKLVSGVTFTTKPPFTLTYRIRPEARWSDGTPITARDFVFTHQTILKHGIPEEPNRTEVRSVRALDAKTVRVVLRTRFAGWRELFGSILPRHALRGEDLLAVWKDRIDNPKTGRSIGSGPFLVERWERGKQLTLVRNPRYWGPHVSYLDRIVLRFCSRCGPTEGEALDALRQGTVDFAHLRDPSIVPSLRRIPGVRVVAAPSLGWDHLALRIGPGGHPALRQKLVRRALAYGIDRIAIARQLFGEIDPKYAPSDSAAHLNTSRSYRPNWKGYRYRPALSRRLLEQAGCRRGLDGIYVCDGTRLSLRFWTIAGVPVRQRGLELIQSQLRRAGVEIELQFAPARPFFEQILPSGGFDAASFSWFGSSDALAAKDIFGCGGDLNWYGYCQRLVTSDLDQAGRILDAQQRSRVLNRADRQMAKDVPFIPLYQIPFLTAFRNEIRNVVAAPFNVLWNAENWWLAR